MSTKRKRHTTEQIIGKLREADIMLANGSSLGQVKAEGKFMEKRDGIGKD